MSKLTYWQQIQLFYDQLGHRNSLSNIYEQQARMLALSRLAALPDENVLEVGVGNGLSQSALNAAVGAGGQSVALDLSPVMLHLTAQDHPQTHLTQAHAYHLPYASAQFDALLSLYLLDLIPNTELLNVLLEFKRVLKPRGRLVLASLTEGIGPISGIGIGLWKAIYGFNPMLCGGCRPVQLMDAVREAGFTEVASQIVVQMAIPSEVLSAVRP